MYPRLVLISGQSLSQLPDCQDYGYAPCLLNRSWINTDIFVHTHTHRQIKYGCQRTTCRRCFSASTLWITGIELRLSVLAASTVTQHAIFLVLPGVLNLSESHQPLRLQQGQLTGIPLLPARPLRAEQLRALLTAHLDGYQVASLDHFADACRTAVQPAVPLLGNLAEILIL